MSRTKKTAKKYYDHKRKDSNPKDRACSKDRDERENEVRRGPNNTTKLEKGDRDNDPNYYFTDKMLADQVTQMSFQQIAGFPVEIMGNKYPVPNIVSIAINPAPGVTNSADYGSVTLNKMAGINLAGFKLFSALSAYTGRVASYGPQDISTMILGLGEILSISEFIRRTFGVSYTMNYRNWSYPRDLIQSGLFTDSDDLFTHYSDYRTRFNAIITLINRIPIPDNIEYLRKCMEMYQRIYVDTPSAMAQTLIPMPFTTWQLDETSYAGGTILKTVPVVANAAFSNFRTPTVMSDYLDILENLVGAMLNSSTLQTVYMDLLNYASKVGAKFRKLDYLAEGYSVYPEYNANFILQMHNATICGTPNTQTSLLTGAYNVTPYNDVYPNAATNSLFYNPAFRTVSTLPNGGPRTGNVILVDMLNDNPTVEDRVEVTRYASVSGTVYYENTNLKLCDAIVTDHYIATVGFWTNETGTSVCHDIQTTILPGDDGNGTDLFKDVACWVSNIDWAPRFYEVKYGTSTLTGHSVGDLNFYTILSADWFKKVNRFIALGLYDFR